MRRKVAVMICAALIASMLGACGGSSGTSSGQAQAPAEEAAAFVFRKLRNNAKYPAGRRFKNVLGSYLHLHFAGCPQAAVNFVSQCAAYRQKRGQDNGKI